MRTRILGGVALSLGALASNASAADGIVREFAVGAGGTLVVEAESAKLDVRGGGDGVRVSISRGDDSTADIEKDFDIDFDASDERVYIGAKRRDGMLRNIGFQRQLTIKVETPQAFDVDLTTSGGSVHASHLAGTIQATTSGGSMRFENVDGAIDGKTSGGSIRLSGTSADARLTTSGGTISVGEVGGHVRAKTSGGKIVIEHAGGGVWAKTSGGSIAIGAAKAVDATTSGGSIRLTLTGQPEEDSRLATSGGSIDVRLASNVALDVEGQSSGGRVRVADSLAFQGESSKTSISGKLNDGGPELAMRTSGGSIRLQALR